jgi:hypothetical protein
MKLYKNNKTGGIYDLLFEAVNVTSNTEEKVIVYQHIETEKLYVRNKYEFYEKFTLLPRESDD